MRLTVLLPTYNRAGSLSRTIESVLAQTREDFELLISDNASEDNTEAVCGQYVQRDARVRYFRQPSNLGPIGNFNWLLAQPETEFVLMLADDDWLDADYLACCLALIERDPALSIVTGATRYFEAGARPDLVLNTNLTDAAGARRVLRYLRHSWSSAAFYGLLRTSMVKDALPIPNVMGADWLFVSALSFSGRVLTTTDTHLNRTRGGTSANFQRIAEVSVLSSRAARNPHLSIAFNQFRDIAFSSASYARLSPTRRFILGLASAAAIVAGHPLDVVWDAFGPFIVHPRIERFTRPLLDRLRAHRSV